MNKHYPGMIDPPGKLRYRFNRSFIKKPCINILRYIALFIFGFMIGAGLTALIMGAL